MVPHKATRLVLSNIITWCKGPTDTRVGPVVWSACSQNTAMVQHKCALWAIPSLSKHGSVGLCSPHRVLVARLLLLLRAAAAAAAAS